jgi:hypothetical protein
MTPNYRNVTRAISVEILRASRLAIVPFAIGALIASFGCNTSFARTPDEDRALYPSPSPAATGGATSAVSPVNSGIHGSIHGGGGTAPGTSFHPAGPCVTILDSSGALIAKADCNDRGEFRVNLPAGAYTVQAVGQTLRVRVTAGAWSTVYFRRNMR